MTEKLCLINHQVRDCENILPPHGNLHHKCRYFCKALMKIGSEYRRVNWCLIERHNLIILRGGSA